MTSPAILFSFRQLATIASMLGSQAPFDEGRRARRALRRSSDSDIIIRGCGQRARRRELELQSWQLKHLVPRSL
jgi:hypothetical protein